MHAAWPIKCATLFWTITPTFPGGQLQFFTNGNRSRWPIEKLQNLQLHPNCVVTLRVICNTTLNSAFWSQLSQYFITQQQNESAFEISDGFSEDVFEMFAVLGNSFNSLLTIYYIPTVFDQNFFFRTQHVVPSPCSSSRLNATLNFFFNNNNNNKIIIII